MHMDKRIRARGDRVFAWINGDVYVLRDVKYEIRMAGRRCQRWHRFIKGFCDRTGEFMTFCLGVVRDALDIEHKIETMGREVYYQARILFERLLERIGPKLMVDVLSMANLWA